MSSGDWSDGSSDRQYNVANNYRSYYDGVSTNTEMGSPNELFMDGGGLGHSGSRSGGLSPADASFTSQHEWTLGQDLSGIESGIAAKNSATGFPLVAPYAPTFFSLHAQLNAFLKAWKPPLELLGDNVIAQIAALSQKLENLAQYSGYVGFFPPPAWNIGLMGAESGNFGIRDRKKGPGKWYCVYCFNNARFVFEICGWALSPIFFGPWRTHVCKDADGAVVCPVLASHVCRHCGATGKYAHTEKYCDQEAKRRRKQVKNINFAYRPVRIC